jgi:hypothetical protein
VDDNPNMTWTWAPGLRRCPKRAISRKAWMMVGWWREWKRYGIFPYGHTTIADEPAFVFEAIDAAECEYDRVQSEIAARPPEPGHG